MLKDIQELFYSLQGPEVVKEDFYYAMIFSSNFVKAFDTAPNGRKLLMSLAVTYFQERIQADRNMVLSKIDTLRLYGKNLYYGIEKMTIEVNADKKFKYADSAKACEFLLEPEVDNNKEREQQIKEKQKKMQEKNPQNKKTETITKEEEAKKN